MNITAKKLTTRIEVGGSGMAECCVDKKRPRGKAVITPAVVAEIAEKMALGLTQAEACRAVNVELPTFQRTLERHPEHREAVDRIAGKFIETGLRRINAGERGWQGTAWILERRYRDRFGRTADVQVNNSISIGLTEEQAKAIQDEARARLSQMPAAITTSKA